jgi:hypothetical protein
MPSGLENLSLFKNFNNLYLLEGKRKAAIGFAFKDD